jgi:hypothetical protein
LFRISISIRDPAPHNQHRNVITVDKSYYEQFDIVHVRAKFPSCESADLIDRLGRAISGRRQYLSYREEHHKKLASGVEKLGHEDRQTEYTTNSTEVSAVPRGELNEPDGADGGEGGGKARGDDCDDALSHTSYATSINATMRVPALPEEAYEHEHFECPLCFMVLSIHDTQAWK